MGEQSERQWMREEKLKDQLQEAERAIVALKADRDEANKKVDALKEKIDHLKDELEDAEYKRDEFRDEANEYRADADVAEADRDAAEELQDIAVEALREEKREALEMLRRLEFSHGWSCPLCKFDWKAAGKARACHADGCDLKLAIFRLDLNLNRTEYVQL